MVYIIIKITSNNIKAKFSSDNVLTVLKRYRFSFIYYIIPDLITFIYYIAIIMSNVPTSVSVTKRQESRFSKIKLKHIITAVHGKPLCKFFFFKS